MTRTAAGPGEQGSAALEPERLLVAIAAVGAVAALYLCRGADDNRLTSWAWAFARADPARLHALVAAGSLLAWLVARLPLPGPRPAAVLFLASCAVGASFWGAPEVVVDASRYFTQAKHLEVYGLGHFLSQWGEAIPAWTDLPLVPLLHGLVFELLGERRILAQALGTLLFAGAVVLTYGLGRALWDEEVGFAGGAFLLAIPHLLVQVPAMLVDVPSMFFFLLAVVAVVRAVRRGGAGPILLASGAVFLALLSKYSVWLLLSVLPVIWIVHRREGTPRALRRGAAVASIAGALAAVALISRRDVLSAQVGLLLGYQAPGLRRWGESLVSTFLFQTHPFLTGAALLSAWVAWRRRDPRFAVAAWPVLLLLALQVQRARYWIPAFPMVALMGALGLKAFRSGPLRATILACAVASSLAVALCGFLPFLKSTSAVNLQRAGEYLDSIDEKGAVVFALSGADREVNPEIALPLLDLYTAKRLVRGCPPASPPPGVETSPLRFTWEWRTPAYYEADAEGGEAAVVISPDLEAPLPRSVEARLEGLRLARTFTACEGVFAYRTLVRVYRAARGGPAPVCPVR